MQLRKVRQREWGLPNTVLQVLFLQGCVLALNAQLPRGPGQLCRRLLHRPARTQNRVPEKLTKRSLDSVQSGLRVQQGCLNVLLTRLTQH